MGKGVTRENKFGARESKSLNYKITPIIAGLALFLIFSKTIIKENLPHLTRQIDVNIRKKVC